MSAAAQSLNGNLKKAGLRFVNLEGFRWRVLAKGQFLGRLAPHVSTVFEGKDKPTYTLNRDEGDMCFSINAKEESVAGKNMTDNFYRWHTRSLISPSTLCYQFNTRRGFSKARKQQIKEEEEEEDEEEEEEEEEEDDDEKGSDLVQTVKNAAVSQMSAAVDALSRELAKLRTGRASPGILDHIMVEHYGVKTPLSRMAVVSVLDPKTLAVTPYDQNALKELEKAIGTSPLGLNPKSDDQRLIVPIPPLTKEHMQAVCKVVAKSSEDVKQSIRRVRQKALESIKKATPKKNAKDKGGKDKDKSGSSMSEDGAKRLEKEIDDLTKKFNKTAEDMCKAKEKEIRGG